MGLQNSVGMALFLILSTVYVASAAQVLVSDSTQTDANTQKSWAGIIGTFDINRFGQDEKPLTYQMTEGKKAIRNNIPRDYIDNPMNGYSQTVQPGQATIGESIVTVSAGNGSGTTPKQQDLLEIPKPTTPISSEPIPLPKGYVQIEQPGEQVEKVQKRDYNSDYFVLIGENYPEKQAQGIRAPDVIEYLPAQLEEIRESDNSQGNTWSSKEIIVGGKKAAIEKSGNQTRIVSSGITATTAEKIDIEDDQIKISGTAINVMPSTAAQKATQGQGIRKIEKITVQMEGKPIYVIELRKTTKLFGIIDIEVETRTKVDAQTSEIVATEKPWWSIFTLE